MQGQGSTLPLGAEQMPLGARAGHRGPTPPSLTLASAPLGHAMEDCGHVCIPHYTKLRDSRNNAFHTPVQHTGLSLHMAGAQSIFLF